MKRTILSAIAMALVWSGPAWAANGAPAAPIRATAAERLTASTPMRLYEDAYRRAVALHVAVSMGQWDAASEHLRELRRQLVALEARGDLPSSLAAKLDGLRPLMEPLAQSVQARDASQANDDAFILVIGFADAVPVAAMPGGGGGEVVTPGADPAPTDAAGADDAGTAPEADDIDRERPNQSGRQ
jgi:hypothetical protein